MLESDGREWKGAAGESGNGDWLRGEERELGREKTEEWRGSGDWEQRMGAEGWI